MTPTFLALVEEAEVNWGSWHRALLRSAEGRVQLAASHSAPWVLLLELCSGQALLRNHGGHGVLSWQKGGVLEIEPRALGKLG